MFICLYSLIFKLYDTRKIACDILVLVNLQYKFLGSSSRWATLNDDSFLILHRIHDTNEDRLLDGLEIYHSIVHIVEDRLAPSEVVDGKYQPAFHRKREIILNNLVRKCKTEYCRNCNTFVSSCTDAAMSLEWSFSNNFIL